MDLAGRFRNVHSTALSQEHCANHSVSRSHMNSFTAPDAADTSGSCVARILVDALATFIWQFRTKDLCRVVIGPL